MVHGREIKPKKRIKPVKPQFMRVDRLLVKKDVRFGRRKWKSVGSWKRRIKAITVKRN